ncbi:MAG: hypothetical protein WDM79_19335 [Terricaulis sp.]
MNVHTRSWIADFEFSPQGVYAKKAGTVVPFTRDLVRDFGRFLLFFFYVRFLSTPMKGAAIAAAFAPDRPRPWYLIWPVLRLAGVRIVSDPRNADLVMHFKDATEGRTAAPPTRANARVWNFGCASIAKDRVGEAFARAFGYALAIDPEIWIGPAVEKSQANAAHDGRIIQCPAPRRPGRSYQRLIDNGVGIGLVEDLRTTLVDGKPAVVFVKRRPVESRFENTNAEVYLASPESVFSPRELDQIGVFARELGLQWAGLDILRDRASNQIYIVDANKTDLGPPIGMVLAEKLEAVKMLARALRHALLS